MNDDRERDLQREIQDHLDLEAEASGFYGAAAKNTAERAFGNAMLVREDVRDAWGWRWLRDLQQDVRYGLRAMRKSPGFTVAVVATLALGMGANTAIFSLIDAVLLRSLPVEDPSRLYFLNNAGAKSVGGAPPYPCFERFRAEAKSFTGMAAYSQNDFGIRIDGPIEQVDGAEVSGNYFDVLGVRPAAGRMFEASDEKLDPPAAVISYGFWQSRFGGSPAAIGRTFSLDGALNGRRFTIVGVTQKTFQGLTPGRHDDVMMPITMGADVLKSNNSWFFRAVARLRPGVEPSQAQAEIDPIFQSFMNDNVNVSVEARRDLYHNMVLTPAARGLDLLRQRFADPLWALMAVVALVLLIACANVTNLLLGRAASREREFAIRVAIGAGRLRLFRQLLVETGLLFATGALAGAALAWWSAQTLVAFFARGSHPILLDAHWDWRVVAFTVSLSAVAAMVFGAAPMWRSLRADGARSAVRGGHTRIDAGHLLVAFQVALSLTLIVGAALFLRTLRNLYSVDAGFRPSQVALMVIHLPDASFHEAASRIALWDRLLLEVESLPGVKSASLSRMTPLDGTTRGVGIQIPGFTPRTDDERGIGLNTVSADYFRTMEIPLLAGRNFTANDRMGGQNVALLNEAARRRFFPDRDPIGITVKIRGNAQYQIVGVVQNAKTADLRAEPTPFIFVPVTQPLDMGAFMTLSIRTEIDPRAAISEVRGRLATLGSDIHLVRTDTLEQQLNQSLLQDRLMSTLRTAFGVLALLLSAIGLYGVLAYSVARRTPEIGIRMALGARPEQVAWGILRQTLVLVAAGLAVGIPASMYAAGFGASLLYGVTPRDVSTQVIAALLLTLVAMAASYLPARRAGRVDPLVALRHE